jgi:hypothetical protein
MFGLLLVMPLLFINLLNGIESKNLFKKLLT